MSTSKTNCQNCDSTYEEGCNFCPHCGQKTNEDLTIGVLFYNTISNYFSFDARFLKSFLPLLFRPGYLAKKFIEGKRLLYLHPAQMYLFVTVIFFFVFNFYTRAGREELDKNMQRVLESRSEKLAQRDSLNLKPQDSIAIEEFLKPLQDNGKALGMNDESLKVLDSVSKVKVPKNNIQTNFGFDEKKIDSLLAVGAPDKEIYKSMGMDDDAGYLQQKFFAQMLKFYKDMGLGQVYQIFIDSIPLAMLFLLPVFALLLKLFYFNKGRYAHHLVFSFYYFSFLCIVFCILLSINKWIYDIPDWIDWLIVFSTFFYLYIAVIKFYKQNWFLSFIKTGTISFLFLLFVLPLSFVILGLISFLYY